MPLQQRLTPPHSGPRRLACAALTTLLLAGLSACHPFESADDYPFPELDEASRDLEVTTDGGSDGAPSDLDAARLEVEVGDTLLPDGVGPCLSSADCTCADCECIASVCKVRDCVDGDGDGFGVGAECLGPDCDDQDPFFRPGLTRPCGTTTTPECAGAVAICTALGEEVCTSEGSYELPNGVDDNCDGVADENFSACSFVSPEMVAGAAPYAPDLTTALASATAGMHICLAYGCAAHTVDLPSGALVPPGVLIEGSFDTTGERCTETVTVLRPTGQNGVTFQGVPSTEAPLSGLARLSLQYSAGVASTGAAHAVSVEAGAVVLISEASVGSANQIRHTRAVDVAPEGTVIVARSRLVGGAGDESYGLHVQGTAVVVDNCTDSGAGCAAQCTDTGISGNVHHADSTSSVGINILGNGQLTMLRSAVCAGQGAGSIAVAINGGDLACDGSSCFHFIAGSTLLGPVGLHVARNGQIPVGLSYSTVVVEGTDARAGMGARVPNGGTLHSVGTSFLLAPGSPRNVDGLWCASGATCIVEGNGFFVDNPTLDSAPDQVTGISCDAATCSLYGNVVMGLAPVVAKRFIGVQLLASEGTLDSNWVFSRGDDWSVGLLAQDTSAAVFNNVLVGGYAEADPSPAEAIGVLVRTTAPSPLTYLHSNTIVGLVGSCLNGETSYGVRLEALDAVRGANHLLRNNILHGGLCVDGAAFSQQGAVVPLGMDHNLLFGLGGVAAEVNGVQLPDINPQPFATDNLTGDPGWVDSAEPFRLMAQSPCVDAGTPEGAPALDVLGTPRSGPNNLAPDLGAFEYCEGLDCAQPAPPP